MALIHTLQHLFSGEKLFSSNLPDSTVHKLVHAQFEWLSIAALIFHDC